MEMESSTCAGIAFARRIHAPRSLGCGLSFVFIAVLTYPGHPALWAWMLVNGFLWPGLARFIAVRAAEPYRAELRNLLLDSLFAGGWVAGSGITGNLPVEGGPNALQLLFGGVGMMSAAVTGAALLGVVMIGLVNALVWYGRLHFRLIKPAVEG